MNAFEEFLWANKLKQVDIQRYLSISSASTSNVATGKSCFCQQNLVKLVNNPYGWDTSMFIPLIKEEYLAFIPSSLPSALEEEDKPVVPESSGSTDDSWYRMMFVELSKRVAEQDATIARLQERIKELENK